MFKITLISSLIIASIVMSSLVIAGTHSEVVERSDIQFQPLNPARGDASPQAGVLWGDIKKDVPSGALIVFADGFTSPPHIHNITYRAVVISGAVHNDDPEARKQWMGPGSFWSQPAGESHITAAYKGSRGTAFLEILEGPYLVKPREDAFDNGVRPVNVDASNIVWLDSSELTRVNQSENAITADGPKIAFLWGGLQDDQKNGTMLKIPAGSTIELQGNGSWLRAVVIVGPVNHQLTSEPGRKHLGSGSYFGSTDGTLHKVSCETKTECLIYVSTMGRYGIKQL